jgi:hypothetical protein
MDYLTNYYKNLSEQLQQRVNHLQKLVENANSTDPMEMHGKIRDAIIKLHASKYPHKLRMGKESAESRSAAHIADILNNHKSAPFTSAEAAVKAIAPHAIEGNYDLEARIYDRRPEIGGDISEHPDYESFVMDNEADYTEDLISGVEKAIKSNKSSTQPFHIERIDRVEGHENNPDGWGARYEGIGPDGQKYSFWHRGGEDDILPIGRVKSDNPNITDISKIK